MVGGISAVSPYISSAYGYTGYGRNNMPKNTAVQGVDGASRPQPGQNVGSVYGAQTRIGNGAVLSVGRSASPGTPIEPIQPISKLEANGSRGIGNTIPFLREGMDPAELAVRMRMKYSFGTEGVQKNTEEGECQTCKERKYQDGSDDAGVSYKTPCCEGTCSRRA